MYKAKTTHKYLIYKWLYVYFEVSSGFEPLYAVLQTAA